MQAGGKYWQKKIPAILCVQQYTCTYYLQCLQVEEQHWKLDDLMEVIVRVYLLTGCLKVKHTEIVQAVGVRLHLADQVPRRRRLTKDQLPPHVLLQALAKNDIFTSEIKMCYYM